MNLPRKRGLARRGNHNVNTDFKDENEKGLKKRQNRKSPLVKIKKRDIIKKPIEANLETIREVYIETNILSEYSNYSALIVIMSKITTAIKVSRTVLSLKLLKFPREKWGKPPPEDNKKFCPFCKAI